MALHTPYAQRTRVTHSSGGSRGSLSLPYFSYTDPHLAHYFRKKLRLRSPSATPTKQDVAQSHTPRTDRSYVITIATAQGRQSGTTAKVYASLVGSKGKSLRHRLLKHDGDTVFSPGSTLRFQVTCCDLGDLRSLTLEHTGLTKEEAWLVDHVTVRGEGQCWVFPCHQWLSLHHSGGKVSRTLTSQWGHLSPKSSTSYVLDIHTGDVRGGGTEAHVFVTLHGSLGSSAKTEMSGTFSRGSVVRGWVRGCRDLGRLERVDVEHDNSGFAPDWFLDKVVVGREGGAEEGVTCPCAQWLSRRVGDGQLFRTLHPTSSPSPLSPHTTSYTITTKTGSMRGAGTDANVYVTLYGEEGESGERRLDNDPANFERGMEDQFNIVSTRLGKVERLSVRHDNSGLGPGWYLEWVEVRDEDSKEVWHFPCQQWLALGEGRRGDGGGGGSEDGSGEGVEVELVVGEKKGGASNKESGHKYTLEVTTGDIAGGGTSAGVYVVMVGSGGDSGKLWLDNGRPSLLQGQMDTFVVTSPLLFSPLHTLIVGHNNSGQTPGWFLDKVEVVCGGTGERSRFPCGRWLCMDCDDGRIERELHAVKEERERSDEEWVVRVWTSDMRGAGTDATVSIQLHGTECSSPMIALSGGDECFQEGEEDVFPITLPHSLLPLSSLTLSHDNTGPYPEWHVDRVAVENSSTRESYMFQCGRWISGEAGRCSLTFTSPQHVPASLAGSLSPPTPITLSTAHPDSPQEVDVSSEDEVSLSLSIGEDKQVGSQECSPAHPSMHGSMSTMTSQYLQQLRAAQHSSMDSPSEYQEEKTIPYTIHTVITQSHSRSSGHLQVEVIGKGGASSGPLPLSPVEGSSSSSSGNTDIFSVEGKDVGEPALVKVCVTGDCVEKWSVEEVVVHIPTTGHTYHFPWGGWLEPEVTYDLVAEEAPCSVTSSTLVSSSACGDSHSNQPTMIGYEVKVLTADKKQAGTGNNVHLVVVGEKGTSKEIVLKNSQREQKFQRGQTDSFQITIPDTIGSPIAVSVAHCPPSTTSSLSGQWYLFDVVLCKLQSRESYHFPCRTWLSPSSCNSPNFVSLSLSKTSS